MKDLVREQVLQKHKDKESNTAKDMKASSNSKPLTAYFSTKGV